MNIEHIQQMYRDALKEFGRSSAAVLCPKGRHENRFAALLKNCPRDSISILDYGCGLGHLLSYLQQNSLNMQYTGVDIVHDFIISNRATFPAGAFHLISGVDDVSGSHDIVLASGVFNIAYEEDPARNLELVQHHLATLFAAAGRALAVDFMTTHVDYKQPGAFHVNPAQIIDFALTKLSRRVILDNSYLPFEFCLTVLKDQSIDRERGVYACS